MDFNGNNKNMLKGYNMLFYFAGSMIMHEPSEECIVDFWEKGIIKNLPVSSTNPNFMIAASQLRESFTDKSTFAKSLHEDYLRLFKESPDALAPAYESKYSNGLYESTGYNQGDVTDFYNSYGWKSRFKGKIKDDHLGIELLFLTLLIDKYMTFDDNACRTEMEHEICRFINNHILSWVPEWNLKVQENSLTLSFKGIGNLIMASAEDILNIFSTATSSLVSTSFVKN